MTCGSGRSKRWRPTYGRRPNTVPSPSPLSADGSRVATASTSQRHPDPRRQKCGWKAHRTSASTRDPHAEPAIWRRSTTSAARFKVGSAGRREIPETRVGSCGDRPHGTLAAPLKVEVTEPGATADVAGPACATEHGRDGRCRHLSAIGGAKWVPANAIRCAVGRKVPGSRGADPFGTQRSPVQIRPTRPGQRLYLTRCQMLCRHKAGDR